MMNGLNDDTIIFILKLLNVYNLLKMTTLSKIFRRFILVSIKHFKIDLHNQYNFTDDNLKLFENANVIKSHNPLFKVIAKNRDQEQLDILLIIKQLLWSKQDKWIKSCNFIKQQNNYNSLKLKYYSTFLIDTIQPKCDNTYKITLPKFDPAKYVFKNLRFKNMKCDSFIDIIKITIGGNCIDEIDGNLFNVLRYIYGIEDQFIIPLHICAYNYLCSFNADINIYIKTVQKNSIIDRTSDIYIDIICDIYEKFDQGEYLISLLKSNKHYSTKRQKFISLYEKFNSTACEHNEKNMIAILRKKKAITCNYAIIQSQFSEKNKIESQEVSYKLKLKKICTHIILNTYDNEIEKLSISLDYYVLDKNLVSKIPINNFEIYDKHYIIPLVDSCDFIDMKSNGINFSRIATKIINIKFKNSIDSNKSNNISIYGLNLQNLRGSYQIAFPIYG
jgi:hypothetical protein